MIISLITITLSERITMKNLVIALSLVVGLSACASNAPECTRRPTVRPAPVVTETPATTPVAQPVVPAAQPCCQAKTYTVSEPVEILYKNTTYKTVYEPKTYSTVSYAKKPYTCENGACPQKQVINNPVNNVNAQ